MITPKNKAQMIEVGLKAGQVDMYDEDAIWCRFSGDKIDIGAVLAGAIRTLSRYFPLSKKLRVLSIGSGAEPQLRVLAGAFQGGVYLLDIDREPLRVVRQKCREEQIPQVHTIRANYNKALGPSRISAFPGKHLNGRKVELITLHHSLYYSDALDWPGLFENMRRYLLAGKGGIHAVLMSSRTRQPGTTTWLYNHFAGKFFGAVNNQDLLGLARKLKKSPGYSKDQILTRTHRVKFLPPTFGQFMAVVWMVLLYPNVHDYSLPQREEITEYMWDNFWVKEKPLEQLQDHLVVYRGIPFRGLI